MFHFKRNYRLLDFQNSKIYFRPVVFLILCWCFLSGSVQVMAQRTIDNYTSLQPNILLINIDDLGWTDLGFMGSNYYETPNIDELAANGMIFNQAYAPSSNCAPSRAALFSGKYAPRTGVYTVGNSERGENSRRKLIPVENTEYISENVVTFAQILREAGYKTAHVGKWHITKDPTENGFDINVGGFEAGNPTAFGMGGFFSPYRNPYLEDRAKEEYLTDRLTDETLAILDSVDSQPFFINYAPYIVHLPIQPKAALEEKYRNIATTDRHHNSGYAAMIETMDENVGRILKNLHESGKYENTLIIFTSDNGGLYDISKQWPLRSGKGSYFEGGIRVPMVAVWPGNIERSTTSDQPVNFIDLYPTFLEAAGIDVPEGLVLDGVSLLPVFKGKKLEKRALFWHFPVYLQSYGDDPQTHDPYFRTRPGSVILIHPWKLHEYFEEGRIELYNLDTDIGERKNLVDIFPEITKKLHRKLKEWREEVGASVPDQLNPEYDSD